MSSWRELRAAYDVECNYDGERFQKDGPIYLLGFAAAPDLRRRDSSYQEKSEEFDTPFDEVCLESGLRTWMSPSE